MFSYYIERGHNIKDLMKLSELEKLFYFANMEVENERENEMMKDIEEENYF